MDYNCSPYFHKVTALTASDTAVEMTITNGTNIAELDYFELVLCVNPDTVVTGDPLPYTVNVNGTAVALQNKYGLPINTNRLCPRKKYVGAYVEPETGTPYVILWNTPECARYAQ